MVVGTDAEVFATELIANDLNFIAFDQIGQPFTANAKIRYNAREAQAKITPRADGTLRVVFEQPQRAITPGQSVVFYDGDTVLGGGIIAAVTG